MPFNPPTFSRGGYALTWEFPTGLLRDVQAFTFEGWVRLQSGGTVVLTEIHDYEANSFLLSLWWRNSQLEIYHGNTVDHKTPLGLTAGNWQHLAICMGGDKLRVFLDGAERKVFPMPILSKLSINHVNLGNSWNLPEVLDIAHMRLWKSDKHANIADHRSYDIALYEDLAQMPTGTHKAFQDDESLIGWWPLNEGSGPTAYDHSGHGNNLSLEKGTWSFTGKPTVMIQVTKKGDKIVYPKDMQVFPGDEVEWVFPIEGGVEEVRIASGGGAGKHAGKFTDLLKTDPVQVHPKDRTHHYVLDATVKNDDSVVGMDLTYDIWIDGKNFDPKIKCAPKGKAGKARGR